MTIIRDAKAKDLEEINRILKTNEQIADVTSDEIPGFVVIEEAGTVVGCGMIKDRGNSVEIGKVSVLPDYQKRGYGMEIVLSLLGRIKGRPCWLLSVHSHNFWKLFDFMTIPEEEEPEYMKKQCRLCERRVNCDRVVMFKDGI